MNKIFIILVIALVAMANPSEISAQSRRQLKEINRNIRELNAQRNLEIDRLGDPEDIAPGNMANYTSQVKQINERYDKLISDAMNISQNPASAPKEKREKEPKRTMPGSDLAHQGRSGYFIGNSVSTTRGADAYATVVQAEANAYLTEQYANNIGSAEVISPAGGGLKVVLSNEYRYVDVNINIKNKTTGKETAVFLRRNGKTTVNLPPGEYSYTAWSNNGWKPADAKNFSLRLNNYYEFDGERVGYYIVVGSR